MQVKLFTNEPSEDIQEKVRGIMRESKCPFESLVNLFGKVHHTITENKVVTEIHVDGDNCTVIEY